MKKTSLMVVAAVLVVVSGCASAPRSANVSNAAEQGKKPCYGGMMAGAALGALAGHQVGKGRGKTVATVAGAAAGAAVGQAMCD